MCHSGHVHKEGSYTVVCKAVTMWRNKDRILTHMIFLVLLIILAQYIYAPRTYSYSSLIINAKYYSKSLINPTLYSVGEFSMKIKFFHTKQAQNHLQWQILPKKWVIMAQNGQFWAFCRFFPGMRFRFTQNG